MVATHEILQEGVRASRFANSKEFQRGKCMRSFVLKDRTNSIHVKGSPRSHHGDRKFKMLVQRRMKFAAVWLPMAAYSF